MTGRFGKENLQLVEKRLQIFREDFDVWEAPVDTSLLIRKIAESGKIDLGLQEIASPPDGFDAEARFFPEINGYLIQYRLFPLNWKRFSSARRCNFTLAHELGHIFCGHLSAPDSGKNPIEKMTEGLEADAFASRLLMPAEALGQFRSVQEAADALWVSESAVRRRIRETRLLPAVRACPCCGFSRIPPAARFCRMCGRDLQKNPGPPPDTKIRYFPPAPEECPACGFRGPAAPGGLCLNCEMPKRNHCLPEYDQRQHWCPEDAQYCEVCGAETLYKQLER